MGTLAAADIDTAVDTTAAAADAAGTDTEDVGTRTRPAAVAVAAAAAAAAACAAEQMAEVAEQDTEAKGTAAAVDSDTVVDVEAGTAAAGLRTVHAARRAGTAACALPMARLSIPTGTPDLDKGLAQGGMIAAAGHTAGGIGRAAEIAS